jgi:regulator of protease activity HflC (stomatin/prohibitin superfamily)
MSAANNLPSSRWLGVVGLVVVVLLVWLVASNLTATVPAGHVGVVSTFGKVHEETLPEGLHLVAPWNSVHKMSARTQGMEQHMDALTTDGASVAVDASLLFSLDRGQAAQVYQTIGGDEGDGGYVKTVVEPEFRAATRRTVANYRAEALYSDKRSTVETELQQYLEGVLQKRGIVCEKVMLRSIQLPPSVKASIDQKMVAEQKAEAMKYELMTAEQEAKRKLIEAKATADAQETIKKTLDETYIRYLWVKALETAAQNHSATIYVPTGRDGLPLVSTLTPAGGGDVKDGK